MNREILFRGKRVDNGEWIEGFYGIKGAGTDYEHHFIIQNTLDANHKFVYFYLADIEILPETVGQFTGLTDKNGTKIFEGDILKVAEFGNTGIIDMTESERDLFTIEDLKGITKERYISAVIFEEGGFVIKSDPELDYYDTALCCLFGDMKHSQPIFEFEAIGNIHDNPKLLK